jgi:hypothetical protein
VLFVSGSLPDIKCGVGKYTSRLLRAFLNKTDLELAVLTVNHTNIKPISGVNHFYSIGKTITKSDIRLVIKAFSPNIVHFQFPTVGLIEDSALRTVRNQGIPVIQTWHEHFNDCEALNIEHARNIDGLVYVRENSLARLPSGIESLLKSIETRYIENISMLETELIDADQLLPAIHKILDSKKPRLNLFYFGFIHRNKGLLELIKQLDFSKYHLFISGEIDPQNKYILELIETIESLQLSEFVTFCGYLKDIEIVSFIDLADAIVFPFQEGVGNFNTTYLAALQSDTLVIATDLEKTVYDDEGHCMYLQSNSLTSINSIESSTFQKKRRSINSTNWHEVARQHMELYRKILRRKDEYV